MKKIALIGAFDRFNYGDLIFPIITEKVLTESNYIKNNYKIEFYGLKDSNLNKYGGIKTRALYKLLNKKIEKNSALIIVGGEILGANWFSMFACLIPNLSFIILNKIKKIVKQNKIEIIIKKILRSKRKLPWIIDKNTLIEQPIKLIYNSIGGSNINSITNDFQKEIINKFHKTDLISVRDERTKELLNLLSNNSLNINLAPDSAILMSKYFPLNLLKQKINSETEIIIKKAQSYIVFQINLQNYKKNKEEIINNLQKIYNKYKLQILLLPLGRASGHSDHLALKKIKRNIKVNTTLINNYTIYDIMYLIAKSEMFIGTSLHGNITAISYEVPNMGLGKNIIKLDQFLKTWNIINKGCVDYKNMFNEFENIKNYDKEIIKKKKDELISLSYNNLLKIRKILEN